MEAKRLAGIGAVPANARADQISGAGASGVQPLSFSVNLGFVARANTQSDVDALVSALLLDRGGAAHTELG